MIMQSMPMNYHCQSVAVIFLDNLLSFKSNLPHSDRTNS